MKSETGQIIPDTHAPYHDEEAVEAQFTWAKKRKWDRVIHQGDGCDFYSASRFKKDPKRKLLVVEEAGEAEEVLTRMRKLAPVADYILGNHEVRYENYVRENAPALEGITSAAKLLGLDKWSSVTGYMKHLKIGKIYFTHDLGKHGINAVRDAQKSYQHSVVIGHVHRMQIEYVGNAAGERRIGAALGWQGDVEKVDYRHEHLARTEWQLGFGSYEIDRRGMFHVRAHPIVKGRVLC